MKAEAEKFKEEDQKLQERVEKLNAADTLIFSTEKQLKEYGDKIPGEKKIVIETAVAKLKEAHKNQDLDALEVASKELNDAWQSASQDLYNAQQAQGGEEQHHDHDEPHQEEQSEADSNVTDVPYEEVK